MNRFTLLATFLLAFVMCGCGLSHSDVKVLIEGDREFSRSKEAVLWTGDGVLFSPLDPLYPGLQSLGLIEVNELELGIAGNPFPIVKAFVRLKQEQLAKKEWRRIAEESGSIRWSVPVANRICIGIAGIRQIGQNTREVQFDWKWHLTRYGEAMAVQHSAVEHRHSDLLNRLDKLRQAKEDYEHSHGVLMLGQNSVFSMTLKAIGDDYQHRFVQILDQTKTHRAVLTLNKYDTGWQIGQEGREKLEESLGTADGKTTVAVIESRPVILDCSDCVRSSAAPFRSAIHPNSIISTLRGGLR